MVMLTTRVIGDEEWRSQCGQSKAARPWNFKSAPRAGKEPPELDVSMLLGRLTAREAEVAAFGSVRRPDKRRAVRHVRAGDLRAAGFRVEHTPRPGTLDHVSVFWDGEGVWDESVSASLSNCCTEGEV